MPAPPGGLGLHATISAPFRHPCDSRHHGGSHLRPMKILDTRVYRGPNLYALRKVIRLRVDLGELEDYPTGRLPGFVDRLLEAVPTLQEHTCSYGEPGGFVRRMTEDEGTWLGHVLEHVAIELQCLAGTPVSYGKTRGQDLPRGQYYVIYSFLEESVGIAAAELGLS